MRLTSDITEAECDSGTSTRVAVVGNMTGLSLGTLLVNWTVSGLATHEGLSSLDKNMLLTVRVGFLTVPT